MHSCTCKLTLLLSFLKRLTDDSWEPLFETNCRYTVNRNLLLAYRNLRFALEDELLNNKALGPCAARAVGRTGPAVGGSPAAPKRANPTPHWQVAGV